MRKSRMIFTNGSDEKSFARMCMVGIIYCPKAWRKTWTKWAFVAIACGKIEG